MKFVYLIMAIIMLSVLALAGCQTANPVTTSTAANTTTPVTSGTTAASSPDSNTPDITTTAPVTSAPFTITDDLGRIVELKSMPQRIISLSPSNTEIVYALGLQDRLIGVTIYCNYPEEAKSKPRVSEFSVVDVEKIVSLQPDLVLADEIHKTEVVPALEKLGLPVIVLRPGTIDQIMQDLELVSMVTGKTQDTASLVAALRQRVKAVTDKTSLAAEKPRLLYVTWHDPIWTAGDNTIVGELFKDAGAVNIAGELNGYATITLETVIERNPQIIVVMSSMGDLDTSLNYIKTEPRFQATDAVKNNQVYLIDADIFGRTTPRIIDGLETLARIVHPELFK